MKISDHIVQYLINLMFKVNYVRALFKIKYILQAIFLLILLNDISVLVFSQFLNPKILRTDKLFPVK